MRAISGAGKSTFINNFINHHQNKIIKVVSADYYFTSNGQYNFDATKLNAAHSQCMNNYKTYLEDDTTEIVIVDNTNLRYKEMKYYIDLANEYKFTWKIIQINTPIEVIIERQKTCKNIPIEKIYQMKSRLDCCALIEEVKQNIIFVNGEDYENIFTIEL